MLDFLGRLFDTSGFPPRWHCGSWTAGHGWLHILSDLGVWSAYLAIPCVLGFFLLRRRDIPFRLIFALFGAFILACGATHLMEAVIFWWPAYRLAGVIKLFTALTSWATILALVRVAPRALAMRSPEELEREIERRKQVEAELTEANARLQQEAAERRAAVEALQHSEAMFQGLFQYAPDAVLVTDPDGCIRQVNRQAERMFGYSRDELAGQPVELLIPERFRERHRQYRTRYSSSPRARPMGEGRELFARCKDGAEFPADVMLSPLETPDGPLTLATVRDISHRKANEDLLKARARQQAAVAALGRRALESTDYAAFLEEAVAVVSDTIEVPLCEVAEVLPDGQGLGLRAGRGWDPGEFGGPAGEAAEGSQAGYCLGSGGPVIVPDLRSEGRFVPSPRLLRHGAVSGLSVSLPNGARPAGVLSVWATGPRRFSAEDVVFVQAVAHVLAALHQRLGAFQSLRRAHEELQKAAERVRAALVEKEVLLKEVHHRVKNNLQVVSSLLDLQSSYAGDAASVEMFRESMGRVRSMALVHERLYCSGDLARVDFAAYVEGLADHLLRTYRLDNGSVRLDLRADADLRLPIDAAVPCGLLLNELLSNCLKHAFRGREGGTVRVGLRRLDGRVELCVADDGVGLPEGLEDFQAAGSFGLQLVAMLAGQLGAATEVRREGGTAVRLTFPLPPARAG